MTYSLNTYIENGEWKGQILTINRSCDTSVRFQSSVLQSDATWVPFFDYTESTAVSTDSIQKKIVILTKYDTLNQLNTSSAILPPPDSKKESVTTYSSNGLIQKITITTTYFSNWEEEKQIITLYAE